MKIYTVKVIESLAEWVSVEAESEAEAVDIVENMHCEGKIDVDCFDDCDYKVTSMVDAEGMNFYIAGADGSHKRKMEKNEILDYLSSSQVVERIKTKMGHPDTVVSASVRDNQVISCEIDNEVEYTVEVIDRVTIKAKSAHEAEEKATAFGFDVVSVKI